MFAKCRGRSPDGDLRLIVLPELCERVLPNTRDRIRRIESSLAEYQPKHSFFTRLLPPHARDKLQTDAADLRACIAEVARLDVTAVDERLRFLIAGSAASCWAPDAPVYEPALVYRLAPAIAWRALREAAHG